MPFSCLYQYMFVEGLPWWLSSKESACNAGCAGSIPGLERPPGGGHGNPLQYSCLENPHGSSSLVGYCLSGFKELDTIEATEDVCTHPFRAMLV